MGRKSSARCALSVWLAVLLLAPPLYADRTRLKPGWNLFSEQQDIELGREAAQEAEKQLPLLNRQQVDDYLNNLGKRLARYAPGYSYPYQFKAVNQAEINAFALPGGFLYVNRGTIEAAENEAQLAGVMAHEISHVALRHGTNQLTKAVAAQAPLAILGGLLGDGGIAGQLAQLGIQVGFTGLFLKFSRTAEKQADLLGTQILYDAGYDPQAMADFFDILQKQSGGRSGIAFFSSHPNPENRQENIEEEIELLGKLNNPQTDSEEFHIIRSYLQSLPPAPKAGERPQAGSGAPTEDGPTGVPDPPSRRTRGYRGEDFALSYPDNWDVHEGRNQVLFAPDGGAGQNWIAYGVLVSVNPIEDRRVDLEEATDRLLDQMIRSNAGMRRVSSSRARVGGQRAIATQLSGRSPLEGRRETDWVFTVLLPEGLFSAIFIVPENDYPDYKRTFQNMVDSIRFRQ